MARLSNRLAHALVASGIRPGDRVAILLPQSLEVLVTHLAVYKMGAIAVPLAGAFGVDAIAYRLLDSGARALVTDDAGLAKLLARPEALDLIVNVDGPRDGAVGFSALVEAASDRPLPISSGPADPALMIYTSGTTGQPKGALHGHRVLFAHVSGVTFTHEGIGQAGDRMWTPSDWAWAGGLLNTVLPALALGVPVVAQPRGKFDPEAALRADEARRGAQRLHPAHRAAHDAAGAEPARKIRLRAAHGGLGRRGFGRGDVRLGPRGPRRAGERVLRPDRMQLRHRLRGGAGRGQGRRHRQGGARP